MCSWPLPLDEALAIARQLCDALAAAHARGIVHRDVKPANVMLTQDGRPILMDFGLAKVAGATRLTRTGMAMGTAAYMSPEQFTSGTVDQRADIWSLGVVLYEMLVGSAPFRGESEPAVLFAIMNDEPALPSSLNAHVPPGLDGVILRALAKDPARRYPDVAELGGHISRIQADHTLAPVRAPAAPWRRRSRWLAALGGLAAIGLLGALSFKILQGPTASVAVLPFADSAATTEGGSSGDGLARELTAALGQVGGSELKVAGHRSAKRYRQSDQPLREIGRQLDVAALVEGSVSIVGDRLHVTATLTRVRDERQIWSRTVDCRRSEVLGLQSDLAQDIAVALGVRAVETSSPAERSRPVIPEAHELFMLGRARYEEGDPLAAVQLWEQAVAIDSTYAHAWAALSLGRAAAGFLGLAQDPSALGKVQPAAERALALDARLPEAHAALGDLKWYVDWDWPGAEREYRRALELNPNSVDARLEYGYSLVMVGRVEEGVDQAASAADLDPLDAFNQLQVGFNCWVGGLYDRAVTELERLARVFPDYLPAKARLAVCYAAQGRHAEALAIGEQCDLAGSDPRLLESRFAVGGPDSVRAAIRRFEHRYARSPDGYLAATLAWCHWQLGDRAAMAEWFDRLLARPVEPLIESGSFLDIADRCVQCGREDLALRLLEQGYAARSPHMTKLLLWQSFRDLRGEHRFDDLLRRVGYPD